MNKAERDKAFKALEVSVFDTEQRSDTLDKLRRIQLAILNYESANECFPPVEKWRDANGKNGLSWRVHILPYFGKKEAELYRKFKLSEPWDSEHNKKLLNEIPNCYRLSDNWLEPDHQTTRTVFLAPKGKGTVLGQDSVVRMSDVRDGLSKTLSVVQVDDKAAVPWTSPSDYEYALDNPADKLRFSENGVGLGAACDGSVHELKKSWDASKYLRLFQRDDGQPVRW